MTEMSSIIHKHTVFISDLLHLQHVTQGRSSLAFKSHKSA